jgi:ergothioneine biosynthesis protein EgtB
MNNTLLERFLDVRARTVVLCSTLQTEDYVAQPVQHVSPPKWHLGHTSWFFETFILQQNHKNYRIYHEQYPFIFNSYYESLGEKVSSGKRGSLTRPTVKEVMDYRTYIDEHMSSLLDGMKASGDLAYLIELGLNHEQQHQELLVTDIKYILGHNLLFPPYGDRLEENLTPAGNNDFMEIEAGNYQIGYSGDGFSFDNEKERHRVYCHAFKISSRLVTKGDYLDFMNDGGYDNFEYWHAEGWDWLNGNGINAPLYWHSRDGQWYEYTLQGLKPVDKNESLCHISFYEAAAFAEWKGKRLPTEAEWEVASSKFKWGERWEWTNSAYLPYPGFSKAEGAVGEYNGKFMVNQMVLRGSSVATPPGHGRNTYRNFFHPSERWQYTGIRLAE